MIELLIVVAIILIIAAIAIPNLLRARIAANESSAASSVRSIATAEVTYNAAYPTLGYAAALSNLGGPACGMHSEFGHGLPDRHRAFDRGEERLRVQGYGLSFRQRPRQHLVCGGCCPVRVQPDGCPQLLHNYGWSFAQQSGRVGRIAGPRRSDLRGLRDRPIDQRFQPVPAVPLPLRFPRPESGPLLS